MSKIIVQSMAIFCMVLFVSTTVSSYAATNTTPQEQEPLRAAKDIQKVVRNGMMDILKCYHTVLEDNPDVEGKITYHITIAPDGQVREVDVKENTTDNEDLADCVSTLVHKWHFGRIDEDKEAKITITLPFSP